MVYQPPGAATAAIGQGAPTSLAQRELIERGRGTDLQNAQVQNQQRIAEKEVEYRQAIASGNLDLANRTQNELTDLNNRKLALEQQGQEFSQGLAAGTLTGDYQGQKTLEAQRLAQERALAERGLALQEGEAVGRVGGQETLGRVGLYGQDEAGRSTLEAQKLYGGTQDRPTLEREALYGGSGLINSGYTAETGKMAGYIPGLGPTLEAQQARGYVGGSPTLAREGQEADTALRALQLQSQLRQDPFQLEQMRRGLSATGVPNAIEAVAGRRQLPGVQGPQAIGAQPDLGGAVNGLMSGGLPTFGAMAPASQQLAALPNLNQINSKAYTRLDPSGRRFVNSGLKAAGLAADDDDILDAVQKGLPQFARRGVPTFGRIAA
jgi:hypothetical protein